MHTESQYEAYSVQQGHVMQFCVFVLQHLVSFLLVLQATPMSNFIFCTCSYHTCISQPHYVYHIGILYSGPGDGGKDPGLSNGAIAGIVISAIVVVVVVVVLVIVAIKKKVCRKFFNCVTNTDDGR